MYIKNKFNVGDSIYVNDYFHQKDRRWTTIKAKITCIRIAVFEDEVFVRYLIDKINPDMEFTEDCFYTTKKEAQKRCYELNTGRTNREKNHDRRENVQNNRYNFTRDTTRQ